MLDRLAPSTRLAWLLGSITLGISLPASGQEPSRPAEAPGSNPLREAMNLPDLDEARLLEEIQAASRLIQTDEADPTAVAEARYGLARGGYDAFLPRFFAPQGVAAGGFNDLLLALHQQAGFAVQAIRDLGRPSDAQIQFLKDHEQRMRRVAAMLLDLHGAEGSEVDVVDVIGAHRMALEARSWRLAAESSLQADHGEEVDAH